MVMARIEMSRVQGGRVPRCVLRAAISVNRMLLIVARRSRHVAVGNFRRLGCDNRQLPMPKPQHGPNDRGRAHDDPAQDEAVGQNLGGQLALSQVPTIDQVDRGEPNQGEKDGRRQIPRRDMHLPSAEPRCVRTIEGLSHDHNAFVFRPVRARP